MRGISEEKLIKLAFRIDDHNTVVSLDDALAECRELQEPWMTLDGFLKSGFIGLCWIEFSSELVTDAYFDGYLFKQSSTSDFSHNDNYITRVMPIHKPEPPR